MTTCYLQKLVGRRINGTRVGIQKFPKEIISKSVVSLPKNKF